MSDQTRQILVLVVEDDRDDFFLTEDVLKSVADRKYAAVWTASYETARTELLERRFDVALVDYHIGDRTGLEFIEQVGPDYPGVPMILLTGVDNPDVDKAAEQAGAADFLVKDRLTADGLDRSIRYARQQGERRVLLRAILDNAAVGMVALDVANQPIMWNKEALRALDLTEKFRSQVLSQDIAKLLAGLSKGGKLPDEFRNQLDHAFEISISPVPGGGKVLAFHDVTRRARAEQLLRQAVSDAEAANQAKSSFLTTMSHELRTPLNGLLGMVRVLEGTPLQTDQLSHLQTVRRSGESLLAIVTDVLDLSKIEAGKMELGDVEFELAPLIDDVANLLAPNAFAKGVDVAAFVDPLLPRQMRGDPLRVRQIVTNLVGNAIKFTTKGAVSIHVTQKLADGRRLLQVDVMDTGVGIAEDDCGKLFKKYSQVDAERSRRENGTGLGLALCRELVEMMGGRIWCESGLGKGSTFSFALPQRLPANTVAEAALRNRLSMMKGATLLLVSESAAARQVIDAYVRSVGGRFLAAANDEEALAALRTHPIDALVLDGFDGRPPSASLLQRLKARDGAATRTFQLGSSQIGAPIPLGIDCVLPRPILQRTFTAMCEPFQSRSAAARSSAAPTAPRLERSGRLRILMAEDNEPNRRVAAALLRAAGFSLEIAPNGQKALERVTAEPFDLILMDINMPVMDGIEATKRLRANPATEHMPIIALSANTSVGDRKRCLDAGMTDHIAKPVDWDKLLSLLDGIEQELLGARGAA